MNPEELFQTTFDEHEAVTRATRAALQAPFAELCRCCITALNAGNKVMFFGNGGSAADAQHLAAELVVRFRINRAPMAAIALTTDSSVLTAGANDFGYDTVFECQVRGLGRAGDVGIGLSTSGNSVNVLRALEAAREAGMIAAAFSGGTGGKLPGLADPLLVVPSDSTARIQEMHITIGHMLCDVLEQECGK
ncbi:MAG: D-sedoheptulose 7-phosphate isomerase [Alphaproteobacteria bacterium]